MLRSTLFVLAVLVVLPMATAHSAIVTPGNILVSASDSDTVSEYTAGGAFVQTFGISTTGENPVSNQARDFATDALGNLHVYLGTGKGVLATIDQATGGQTNTTTETFSTGNVAGYGGIAVLGNRVFVNDAKTANDSGNGIISYDIDNGFLATRFATDFASNDLTAGANGLLYALGEDGDSNALNPGKINVYDPSSLLRIEQIDLPTATQNLGLRGLTADAAGRLFAVAFSDQLYRLDEDGNVAESLTLESASSLPTNLMDLDISSTGQLLASERFGEVFVTDTDFSSVSQFNVQIPFNFVSNYYVGFAQPIGVTAIPEPGCLAFLAVSTITLSLRRRRK